MSTFRQKALSGLSWSVVGKVGNQIVTVGLSIVLARLLSPEAFGLIGMVMVFTGFAGLFQDLGLGAALVQHQDVTEDHLSSIFWLNVGAGLLLTIAFIGAAPWIAAFYNEPMLVPIASVVAVNFAIGAWGSVHQTIFQKKIDFRSITLVNIGRVVVSGGIGVFLAFTGYGVWSLVVKSVVATVVGTVGFWIISPWTPSFRFSIAAVKELVGFSLNLLGEKTLNYWVRKTDDLLIGKMVGSDALGLYTKAYGLMLMPLRQISSVISRVMFPSLSTIQDDADRVKKVYMRATRSIALVTFPMMLGLLATSKSAVIAVFGSQWAGMIPILRVFCILGLVQSIGTLIGNLFLSQGRSDLMLRVSLVVKAWMIGAIIFGIQWGVMGVAVCYTIASLTALYPETRYGGGLVGLTFGELIYDLGGIFACAAVMGGAVFALGLALPSEWPHWLQLLTQVPAGVVVYWALVHSFGVEAYREMMDLLAEQWNRRMQATPAE
ncbi:MOP flippase family protein [Salinibacter ruber]|uniref:MOP flippase family protein n=1 Tax=Salinibacter ruber TaxID=146919 RepID=UPI0020733D74|nr:MOP flippase family protein [Salinibacter ruber]